MEHGNFGTMQRLCKLRVGVIIEKRKKQTNQKSPNFNLRILETHGGLNFSKMPEL